ncbi:LuxR C-terminal-related transcriptional regulator [Pseudomonas putida]|uniref:LuxR C-terminal-related transcriptional regulator n=1 Tax=Pseudomonas putida TaxID=303 RepID=UPI002366D6D6|nr:LuxR C-terminal-related transcriptional regulator [Pseudomonas putida]MDD2046649.1 LuxR C-terminal-related transcriptional regulator [Pseudomonas putida]
MHVPRPHLCDLFQRELRLVLLCAPAGYGKTALLQEYLQQDPVSGQVVWLRCGGQRQSLASLSAALARALGLAPETAPEDVLSVLGSGQCGARRLVFDDLPGALPAELNRWFDQLLALDNPGLQLLVSCRQRPDWNLPQLMLMGQLLELNAGQLALRPEAFDALITRLLPDIPGALRDALWQQTGGWCAGVRLLLPMAVADGQLAPHSSSLLYQYLERELLSRLSADQREVLCGLAHLPKASAALCEQLWEGQQGAEVFNSLLACQAFLVPVAQQPGWFRLLPAVAQALQEQLSAASLNRLRLRACRVFSLQGHVDEAVEQALKADQPDVAASYMERLWLSWILGGRHLDTLMDWRQRIDRQLLHSRPRLIYLCAKALLFSGRLDEAEQCLEHLGHFLPVPDPQRHLRLLANWQALQGTLLALRGHCDEARQHCHAALGALTGEDWLSVLLCNCMLWRMAINRGELAEAQALLEQSLELARRQGSYESEVLVNVDRVRLLLLQGQTSRAQALLAAELQRQSGSRSEPCPLLGRLMFLQGQLLLQLGRAEEAEQVVQAGLLQVREGCAPFVLDAYLLLSEVASRRHDSEQAHLLLCDAERRMHWGNVDRACYQQRIARQKSLLLVREQAAPARSPGVPDYQDDLTPREVSVLKLLAEGLSVREVGNRLFISENTVKSHAKNINVKLGACRRTQAINSAKAMGILA